MTRTALVFTLMLAALVIYPNPAAAQGARNLNGTADAASLKSIEVRGRVGSIRLTSGSDTEVRYSVRLTAKSEWHLFGRRTGHPEQLQLRQDRRGDTLTLDLSGDRDNIDEEWVVEVPAGFGARLSLDVGNLRVSGIRGGCETRVDVGDIDVDVPEGAVTADNNVGDIHVRTATSSYGNVDLRADVGKVRVTLDRHQVEHRRSPGAGDKWRLDGPGRDPIRAHTDVGDVEVRIRD
jgi:hypothetical protein